MENNYKLKYQQLKNKFINTIDVVFRLGYEQGMKDAQLDAMEQAQMAQEQQVDENGNPVNPEGQEGEEGAEGQEGEQQEGQPGQEGGSELDQHINQLESMVSKSEINPAELKKALDELKSVRQQADLSKSLAAIRKNNPKPLFSSPKAKKPAFKLPINLKDDAKKALSMQEKIVGDVMKSWEIEESRAKKDITDTLKIENLLKKE